jgi:uncharacterized protein YjiS (DUF1127 family)
MDHTMASKLTTYEANSDSPAPHGSATAAHKLAAFARSFKAYGIWHNIRVLQSQARRHAASAARPWSLSARFGAVAARCARAIANEVRIRRDTRALMLMSDQMLKDIGLTRAEIDRAVRYGRD